MNSKNINVLNKGSWRNSNVSTNNNDQSTIQTGIVITALDQQLEKLYKDFKYLDSVLHTIASRNELGSFTKIKEGIEQLSSLSFTLEDMSIIILLFPKSFDIIWKEISSMNYETNSMTKTLTMCLISSNEWINDYNKENGQPIRPTVTNRLRYFKKTLDSIRESRKGSSDTIKPDISIFPPKPNVSTNINSIQTEALQLAKIAKDKKRKLLNFADEELKEIENVETSGLESIRKLAEKRQKAQEQYDEKKNADMKQLEMTTRMQSLPSIIDTLRSLCISTCRNIRPMKDLINSLAPDMRLQPKELHQRLVLLNEVAPEFINILPADNIVNITTVRINLDCPYTQVRDKIYKLGKSK